MCEYDSAYKSCFTGASSRVSGTPIKPLCASSVGVRCVGGVSVDPVSNNPCSDGGLRFRVEDCEPRTPIHALDCSVCPLATYSFDQSNDANNKQRGCHLSETRRNPELIVDKIIQTGGRAESRKLSRYLEKKKAVGQASMVWSVDCRGRRSLVSPWRLAYGGEITSILGRRRRPAC